MQNIVETELRTFVYRSPISERISLTYKICGIRDTYKDEVLLGPHTFYSFA